MSDLNGEPKCANCPLRQKAEARPKSLLGRVWRWHTNWCPGWKEYQRYLEDQKS